MLRARLPNSVQILRLPLVDPDVVKKVSSPTHVTNNI